MSEAGPGRRLPAARGLPTDEKAATTAAAGTPTATPPPPAFVVRVRPKFREVVLPPAPAPVSRDRAARDIPGQSDPAPPARDDPSRPA